MLENIEELIMSMFQHAWARAIVCSLDLCICSSVLAYTCLFLRFCICGNRPAYAGSCLRMRALTYVREIPSRSPTVPIFTYFSSISLPYATLTHLLVIFAPE